MNFSQPNRRVLKTRGSLGPETDNIYMVGPSRHKWYQSRSSILMWGSVPFGSIRCVCLFGAVIL